MSESTQPALKGIRIGAQKASGPLLIVEGKKQGKNIVMTLTTLNNGEKSNSTVEESTAFSGVFEGIKVKKGTEGFPDKNYLLVRSSDDSLVQIAMSAGLSRDIQSAQSQGLVEGDAIEVVFNGTRKLENGRTFHSYSVNI